MQGGDLSAASPRRFFVTHDVVLHEETSKHEHRKLLRAFTRETTIYNPNMLAMAQLWRWSNNLGVRVELVFLGIDAGTAENLWDMLDNHTSNCFSDHHLYEDVDDLSSDLNFRADVLGIIDKPSRFMAFGARGLTMEDTR